jgi:hypothetical protein
MGGGDFGGTTPIKEPFFSLLGKPQIQASSIISTRRSRYETAGESQDRRTRLPRVSHTPTRDLNALDPTCSKLLLQLRTETGVGYTCFIVQADIEVQGSRTAIARSHLTYKPVRESRLIDLENRFVARIDCRRWSTQHLSALGMPRLMAGRELSLATGSLSNQ